MNNIYSWVSVNYEELLGIIFSFIYLYFSIKQKIWLWPLGLISSAIYTYIFLKSGLYADMGLQIYYVIISVYGWYYWFNNKTPKLNNKKLEIKYLDKKTAGLLLLITIILFIIISQILLYFTDSEIPYWDAFTTAAGITATWMLAKKYIEHWLIWVVVDLISSALYFYKNLNLTVILYIVYTVMAVIGYMQWKKSILPLKASISNEAI